VDARRLIPIGVAVTALLVVAGIASHGRPLSSGLGSGPSGTFFDYLATTLLLIFLALLALFVVAVATQRSAGGGPRRGRRHLYTMIAMLVAAALFAALISRSGVERRLQDIASRVNARGSTQPAHQRGGRTAKQPAPTRIRWDEVAVVLALLAGAGLYFLATGRRRQGLRPLASWRRDAVARALDDSLDDLRSDPDARRAIIAAYARMEAALAAAGVPRHPAETPIEYLERSLVELDAGTVAARRLTELFERAKFSHHEPAEAMRDEAIDALVAVRDDLRAAAEPVAA
jgi:hypothetical protein